MFIKINKDDSERVLEFLENNNIFYDINIDIISEALKEKASNIIKEYAKIIGASSENLDYYLSRKEFLAEYFNESEVFFDKDLLLTLTEEFLEDDEVPVDFIEYNNIHNLVCDLLSNGVEKPVVFNTIVNNIDEILDCNELPIVSFKRILSEEIFKLGYSNRIAKKIVENI